MRQEQEKTATRAGGAEPIPQPATAANDEANGEASGRVQGASDFQRYAEGAQRIQARCACVSWESRECIRLRYREPMDDSERHSDRWQDYLDDECECRCHDELRDLEEDIWGVIE